MAMVQSRPILLWLSLLGAAGNLPGDGLGHWAFQPPQSHPLPTVQNRSWVRTPIDAFVLARLEEKGMRPAPPADRPALIRRSSYDLTGLPPTFEEIQLFEKDRSADAFAKVIDRLLASPRYGERWGRYWLDVARYADTKGYVYTDREEGRFVHSHAYRDWVIGAFNQDLPYDRFLILQIAADQIYRPGAPQNQTGGPWIPETTAVSYGDQRPDLAAMGFLTLGRRFLGVMHEIIDDRIDVLMRGAQALTVSCARCHDHKYDPIPSKDYYSLYGIFAGSTERTVPLRATPESTEKYQTYQKGLKERTDKLNQTFAKKCDELAQRLRNQTREYLVAVLDADQLPTEEFYEIRGPNDLNPVIVRQWQAYLFQSKNQFHPVFALWHAFAELSQNDFQRQSRPLVQSWIAQATTATNEPAQRLNPLVLHAFSTHAPASMREVAQRYGELLISVHQKWQQTVLNAQTNKLPDPSALPDPNEEELRLILYSPDAPVHVPRGAIVDLEWFFEEAGRVELAKLQSEIDRWIIKSDAAPPHAVILEDRPNQRNPRLFVRGNPRNLGEEVQRQFLQALAGSHRQPFSRGSGRLELAQAIAAKDNPLTARVMVNRIWAHHFGAGLVRTPSDFGARSESPSHPELLDWLALRFIEEGWSIKKLHRLIMLSSVYQQSSQTRPDFQAEDSENRLLWRMPRQRLDFEAMRDSFLAAAGELDLSIGGKPSELFQAPYSKRRAVYGFIDRQFLPGVFRVFDFANPDIHSAQRSLTTVPQQALFFMNSPFVAERSRALTQAPEFHARKNDREKIQYLYQRIYQRLPTPNQLQLGLRFLQASQSEPLPDPPRPVPSAWKYGYGEYDPATQQVKQFEPLPHFTGEAWQGGPDWPDPALGWVKIKAGGGHAGNDLRHAAIRRWLAPLDTTIAIEGDIHHEHEKGDGIRARIVSNRRGLLGEWTLHKNKSETKVDSIEVNKGDTVDFIVDYNANLNSDDFTWAPLIKLKGQPVADLSGKYITEWNAKNEFAGPPPVPPQPLNPWGRYAQVLLLSNEFVFVD